MVSIALLSVGNLHLLNHYIELKKDIFVRFEHYWNDSSINKTRIIISLREYIKNHFIRIQHIISHHMWELESVKDLQTLNYTLIKVIGVFVLFCDFKNAMWTMECFYSITCANIFHSIAPIHTSMRPLSWDSSISLLD